MENLLQENRNIKHLTILKKLLNKTEKEKLNETQKKVIVNLIELYEALIKFVVENNLKINNKFDEFILKYENYLATLGRVNLNIIKKNNQARDNIYEDFVNLLLINAVDFNSKRADDLIVGDCGKTIIDYNFEYKFDEYLKKTKPKITYVEKDLDSTIGIKYSTTMKIHNEYEIESDMPTESNKIESPENSEEKLEDKIKTTLPFATFEVKKYVDKNMLGGIDYTCQSIKKSNPNCFVGVVMFVNAIEKKFRYNRLSFDGFYVLTENNRDKFDKNLSNGNVKLSLTNAKSLYRDICNVIEGEDIVQNKSDKYCF